MAHYKENDSLTEKLLRKLIIIVVIMALAIPFITPQVFAASTVSIGCSSSVKGGDTFTVNVAFGGGSVGRVIAYMNYDASKISYISGGSSTGDTGYIQLNEASIDGTVSFELKFRAIEDGDTTLEVITNEIYDLDEMMLDDQPSASKTISISGSAAAKDTSSAATEPSTSESAITYGVDERPEDEIEEAPEANIMMVLVVTAAVLVALIAIISIVLISRKNKKTKPVKNIERVDNAEPVNRMNHEKEEHFKEMQAEHEKKKAVRRKANEETAFWDDWKGVDNGDDDDWIK